MNIHQDKLTSFITVETRLVKSGSVGEEGEDVGFMKVNINDKLSKLKQIYEGFQVDGKYLCGGKLLENMDDTTFAKSFILNNSTVMVMS